MIRRLWVTLALLALLAGCSGAAGAAAPAPPTPTSSAAVTSLPVAVADPTRIEIPAIDVAGDLVALGLNPDGTLAVPPVTRPLVPSWYELGPAPGERGPAVIAGHVDGRIDGRGGQPGIFYRLDELAPGDRVSIDRADGSRVVFEVTRVEQYPKDEFPTADVYGDTPDPQLRLITCGGSFDQAAGSYRANIVVYAVPAE